MKIDSPFHQAAVDFLDQECWAASPVTNLIRHNLIHNTHHHHTHTHTHTGASSGKRLVENVKVEEEACVDIPALLQCQMGPFI